MAEGRDGGDGRVSPFGNHNGDSESRPIMNLPSGASTKVPPSDHFPTSLPQRPADGNMRDVDSAAAGGTIPKVVSKVDPPRTESPFKLGGE